MNELIERIINGLTVRQKANLMTGRDFWSTVPYEDLGLPSAYLSDGPHGLRKQAAEADHLGLNASLPATCFPTAATMANSWNDELGEQMGELLGEEAASLNVNVLLGPGLNIKRNPRCGRNFEYFSEDPYLAGKMAAGYVRGIQKNGVAACLKHFAANNQEERRMVTDSVVDERALREIYLTGFEIAVKEGNPKAIMSSYNKLNGVFANENNKLLKDILRDEWGFGGVIVTDWAGCNDRVLGVKAGNELEMPSCKYGADDIVKAVEDGSLDEALLDKCLERLIPLILTTDEAVKSAPKQFDVEAHDAFAEKCAEECIVLLKNDGVLPLEKSEKVAVIGDFAKNPRYQGAGSSVVNPTKLSSFIDCVKDGKLNVIGYEQGFDRYGKKKNKLKKKALKLAKQADKIIFFAGLDEVTEAEGLDRRNLKIPEAQTDLYNELLKLNKQIIVVLSCGSAVELGCFDSSSAIIHAYLGGQAGARAVYKVLTGEVNPSGKLSESYPASYNDCSSANWFHSGPMTVEYRESVFVGYRYYTTANIPVKYPFGYGLSYTTFGYENLKITDDGVKVTVKNTGSKDGAEVVQMYISKRESKIFRPVRELKGFKKIFLRKGESSEVTIPFDQFTFRYFNVKTQKWEEEGGEYIVEIGASSEDIRLTDKMEREGSTDVLPYDEKKLYSYYSCNLNAITDAQFEELLGRTPPANEYNFYKKNRMVIHENCTVADLKYSKRWVGRLFSWIMRTLNKVAWKTGHKTFANTIEMGVLHQPVRGLAKFGGMNRRQMEALLLMFNGHLFKGIGQFLKKDKKEKGAK